MDDAQTPETDSNNAEPKVQTGLNVSRRGLMKTAAGASVGVAIWAEPTIRGLARRPAYAATASGNPVNTIFNGVIISPPNPTLAGVVVNSQVVDAVTISMVFTNLGGIPTQWTLSASSPGCVCTIDSGTAELIGHPESLDGTFVGPPQSTGVIAASGGIVTFTIPPVPVGFVIVLDSLEGTNLAVTCV